VNLPFGETVTLVRRSITSRDADGNDQPGTAEVTITGVGWDPGTSTEIIQGRDQVVQQARFFLPTGTVVDPLDGIRRASGQLYEVTGEPGDYSSPITGWTPGVTVNVKRVTG
jgi:hypothetical protein